MATTSRISQSQTTEIARVPVSPDPLIAAFKLRSDRLCKLAERGNPLAHRLINNAYDLLAHGISHASEISAADLEVYPSDNGES